MIRSIVPEALQYLIEQRSQHALLDVREYGEYNLAHIPGSTSIPRRKLEFEIASLVPCHSVQIIVCDDDGKRASLAAATLEAIGFTRVAVLEGGINQWASKGMRTQWGMNLIGKEFGERQEVEHHVPTIHPRELAHRMKCGQATVILDTRTVEEYQRHCIPGGLSMPGGELVLKITDIRRDHPESLVVVNCAGRTRSIVGTRLLQRMGVPNVVGLKNGTSGWFLDGQTLEEGANRTDRGNPTRQSIRAAEAFARRIAAEDGVRTLTVDQLGQRLEHSTEECIYRIDVRSAREYVLGHIPEFVHFPGGQAVQRVENVAPVRSAAIIFCCDGIARSFVTASWFRQMGFENVYAVEGGTTAWKTAGRPLESGMNAIEIDPKLTQDDVLTVAPEKLNSSLRSKADVLLLHVGTSAQFAAGHVQGSRWLSRSWLELKIRSLAPDPSRAIVVTGTGHSSELAAATLTQLGYSNVARLDGDVESWRSTDLPIELGLSGVMHAPDDVLPPATGPERSHAEMINYLRWEEALGQKYASNAAK